MISHLLLLFETTLLLSVAALYIIHCPFNKVEESFNTQAIHDIINLFPENLPSNYTQKDNVIELGAQEIASRYHLRWDHMSFPGVVPRTFIGAFIVGLPMKLAKYFLAGGFVSNDNDFDEEPDLTAQFVLQIGSRFALSSFVVLSLSAVTRAVHNRYGLGFRLCFLITTIGQFHYMFYAGRFLPNTFAAVLSNLVLAYWINRQYSKSIIIIALCVVIFRFDTALFFGWLLIDAIFIKKQLQLGRLFKVGVPAGLVALLITFTIDSLFWSRSIWPELEGIYFNLWLNKSHEWGTQPYTWYIHSCIPRMMMASAPLVLIADHKITRDYLLPTLAFIFTYSFLPHKELRFILFVTPVFNISAASGLMNVHYHINKLFLYCYSRVKGGATTNQEQRPKKDLHQKSYVATLIFIIILFGVFFANIFACFILSTISSYNYPGGQAAITLGMTKELLDEAQKSLNTKTDLSDPRSDVGVYVDNLAAQTGVSRFLQVNGAYYAKTPQLNSDTFKKKYNLIYLILEPAEVTGMLKDHCHQDKNTNHPATRSVEKWKISDNEINCELPNQSQMYCSIIDSVNSFKSVNIGGLLRRLKQIQAVTDPLRDGFIKTRVALHILRCSTGSKFNLSS